VDSLGELGVALLPTSAVAGRGSTPSHPAVSLEPGGFAAHVQQAPEAGLPDPAQATQASGQGRTASQPLVAWDSTDLLTSRQPMGLVAQRVDSAAATLWASDGSASLIDQGATVPPALPSLEGEAGEPEPAAARQGQDATSDGPAYAPAMAATAASASSSRLVPDELASEAVPSVVQGETNDPSEPSKPDLWHWDTELESDQSQTLEPLLVGPLSDPPITDRHEGGQAAARSSDPRTEATTGPIEGAAASSPAVPASGGNPAPGALLAPDQGVGPHIPAVSAESPAPVSLAGAGLTGSSEQPHLPPDSAANGGTVEPMRACVSGQAADSGGERPPREDSAAKDVQGASQAGGADERTFRQPPTDSQISRLAYPSSAPSNATFAARPTIGGAADVTQSIHRAPDSAAAVEAGRHPATQMALEITRSLDQHRTEIRIQLDPPELGDVDIHLEFRDLRLTATVSTERLDTLELLQRDARTLVRAFREAGFELADSDLSFAYNGRNDRPDAGPYAQRTIVVPHDVAASAPLHNPSQAMAGPDGYVSLRDGRMDLRA
jgi:flagellar hook-length control protein FliK